MIISIDMEAIMFLVRTKELINYVSSAFKFFIIFIVNEKKFFGFSMINKIIFFMPKMLSLMFSC